MCRFVFVYHNILSSLGPPPTAVIAARRVGAIIFPVPRVVAATGQRDCFQRASATALRRGAPSTTSLVAAGASLMAARVSLVAAMVARVTCRFL